MGGLQSLRPAGGWNCPCTYALGCDYAGSLALGVNVFYGVTQWRPRLAGLRASSASPFATACRAPPSMPRVCESAVASGAGICCIRVVGLPALRHGVDRGLEARATYSAAACAAIVVAAPRTKPRCWRCGRRTRTICRPAVVTALAAFATTYPQSSLVVVSQGERLASVGSGQTNGAALILTGCCHPRRSAQAARNWRGRG
jgi:hypothetical protein